MMITLLSTFKNFTWTILAAVHVCVLFGVWLTVQGVREREDLCARRKMLIAGVILLIFGVYMLVPASLAVYYFRLKTG